MRISCKGYQSGSLEVQVGTYQVVGGPSVSSVSPASGNGPSATFTAQYSDPVAASNIQSADLLISGASGSDANACFVRYIQAANAFYLRDNGNLTWLGGLKPGSSATVSNSQCTIGGTTSSVASNGSTLSVTIPVLFLSAFEGSGVAKSVFGMAMDNNNVSSGYPQIGSWTESPVTVSISPASPSLNANQTVTFTATTNPANSGVTWSINPLVGTINSSGVYTAPSTIPTAQHITVIATSLADGSISSFATVNLVPVTITLSPSVVTLISGQAQAFSPTVSGTTNTTLNWSVTPNVGALTSGTTTGGSNTYTPPNPITSTQTLTLTAVSPVDPASAVTATIQLTPVVVAVTPGGGVTLNRGATQQFTAGVTGSTNGQVTWSLTPAIGSISSSGLYTAPPPAAVNDQQFVTIVATSQAYPSVSATSTLKLAGTVVVSGDFDANGVPDLLWQNNSTSLASLNYYGGTGGATLINSGNLSTTGMAGWRAAAVADFNGDGVPDIVWENNTTGQVSLHYYGGLGGLTDTGSVSTLNGAAGWNLVAAADFNGDGVPDLVWQNATTRQVTVNYYGGAGGAVYQGWAYLNQANEPGWTVVAAADFDGNGVPI